MIGDLDRALDGDLRQLDAHRLAGVLGLLHQHRVRLVVSSEAGEAWAAEGPRAQVTIDAERRVALLEAAESAAMRTLDSNDIPQADSLERVFEIIEMISRHETPDANHLGITARQVAYYRRAGKLLGFLTDSSELTGAGRLIARLNPEERRRATVVHFESSICGDAWIRWSGGKTLLDVDPEQALGFLRDKVPGLCAATAERRAQTLIAWHAELSPHHYAR